MISNPSHLGRKMYKKKKTQVNMRYQNFSTKLKIKKTRAVLQSLQRWNFLCHISQASNSQSKRGCHDVFRLFSALNYILLSFEHSKRSHREGKTL